MIINKIAEFILEKRLKEMESRIYQLEMIIDLGGMTITDILIANKDCNGRLPCTVRGFIEKDRVNDLSWSMCNKNKYPRLKHRHGDKMEFKPIVFWNKTDHNAPFTYRNYIVVR